jgi:hypothetical protein
MHPRLGVALIDLGELREEAEAVLRRSLAEARFGAAFPGYLPILHGSVEPSELPSLTEILEEEFAALPPLSLAGGGAWTEVMSHIVVPGDRIWTDNLEGVPAGRDGRYPRRAAGSGPAQVVPLRLVHPAPPSGARREEVEADDVEDLVWQEERGEQEDLERGWTRGAAESVASLAAVALVAVAIAVGWNSDPYDAPHIPPAPRATAEAPAQEPVLQTGATKVPEALVVRDDGPIAQAESATPTALSAPLAPVAAFPEIASEPTAAALAPLPLPPPAPPRTTEPTIQPSGPGGGARAVRYPAARGDRRRVERPRGNRTPVSKQQAAHR